ncbi:hypothetical protein FACS1894102_7570 [Spirochaetia bacterium]|nr:hypothetical protein FACS1894102_7570 [Spirochaetia bacterium]
MRTGITLSNKINRRVSQREEKSITAKNAKGTRKSKGFNTDSMI